ncbi:Trypsin domain containing protein, partial [Asbolus verrucosus]
MGYLYPGRVVDAAGWGQISDESPGLVDELSYVPLSIIDQYECQTVFGSQLKNSMICAVGNYNEGICFGDIGGPLVTPALIGNHSMHVAIASFMSQNGCESLDPSGFTRVDSYNIANDLTNKLNYVTMSIIDQFECQAYYGDIGGPSVTPTLIGDYTVHVAISNFMNQNGCENTDPNGFTRTDVYHDWIIKAMESTRIIGGEVARAGQFPWQAAIYKHTADGNYFCGGALITEQWILTAGQCVDGAIQFTIKLGSNRLQGNDENRIILSTSTYVLHERFNPETLAHDLGMIKLHMPVTFTGKAVVVLLVKNYNYIIIDYVQSIQIAKMGYIHKGAPGTAAGWGQISDGDYTKKRHLSVIYAYILDSPELSNDLNFVEMTIIANYECQSYFGNQLTGAMTCVVGNYNEGNCFGDIGSPLVTVATLVGNASRHIATASFISQNGCESLDPSGYTRTDSYYNWIT